MPGSNELLLPPVLLAHTGEPSAVSVMFIMLWQTLNHRSIEQRDS